MQQFVIDTNFFINLQRPIGLGASKEDVIKNFIQKTTDIIKKQKAVFLTTPESFKEIASFFENEPQLPQQLNTVITIASPNITNLQLDATLFNVLVEEIGRRLYRGLRASEEVIKNIISDPERTKQEQLQTHIQQLRHKYRQATREKFLDSTIDLGIILLSRERDAELVTSDQGVIMWGRMFGCKELLPEPFMSKLSLLIESDE